MKIRNGFVSNSSSSSFIVCGLEFPDREELIRAYELVGVELTEEQKETIREESSHWEFPDFPGLDIHIPEYDNEVMLGVQTDPTCLCADSCMNGFVDAKEKELLELLSKEFNRSIDTRGGTEYC